MFKVVEESVNHILLHCPTASIGWHIILAIFDVQWMMPFSFAGKAKNFRMQSRRHQYGPYGRGETDKPLKILC